MNDIKIKYVTVDDDNGLIEIYLEESTNLLPHRNCSKKWSITFHLLEGLLENFRDESYAKRHQVKRFDTETTDWIKKSNKYLGVPDIKWDTTDSPNKHWNDPPSRTS